MKTRLPVLAVLVLVASMLLPSCAAPAPQVVEKTVVQTQVVEKPVVQTQVVEKAVVQTQVVEKQVVITPTPAPASATYERSETLYTSGTQWGPPSSWNPMNLGNYAMGTIGLCYETLFLYDPLADKFEPWLAESGKWTDASTYELKIRQGIQWSDGKPFTADDVLFTYELGKKAAVHYSPVWKWLSSIEKVDDSTLRFKFSQTLYQEWAYYLYSIAIVPQHLWSNMSEKDITSGANEKPVGTGPYLYESYDQDRMVWVRNDNWWAIKTLNLKVGPKRIVDIVNGSNATALGLVVQGNVDLSNNFIPGMASLVKSGYGLQTYYPDAPFMLSANTAWLDINLQKKPMDDAKFRRALAYAIDVNEIVTKDYGSIVKAADPTGLLPIWDKYVDPAVVKELGFSYDPAKAKELLAAAGYKDVDGDKFVEAPDGSKIELKVIVPSGWSDWMEAIKIISKNAQAAGINIVPDYPDYGGYLDARLQGKFDLAIDNQPQMGNTPWIFYDWIFQNPIKDIATMQWGNYGRYDNKTAFDLVDQLDKTPIDDTAKMKEIISQLQKIQLTDMPVIPLWHNGLWAQSNTSVWTNWPSSADGASHWLPATWRGYWNMTGIKMLTEIKQAPKQ